MEKDLLLTEAVQQVLKNFSIINTQVLFKRGKVLQIIAPGDNILAEARFNGDAEFKHEFCIYEINKLLAILGLVGGMSIEYNPSHMVISTGKKSSVIYEFASAEAIKKAPYINMPQPEPFDKIVNFDINTFIKAISILELQTVTFEPNGDRKYKVYGSKKTSKNKYEVEAISENVIKNTNKVTVDIEKFKLYNCNKYDITVSQQLIRLDAKPEDVNKEVDISYWIASNEV